MEARQWPMQNALTKNKKSNTKRNVVPKLWKNSTMSEEMISKLLGAFFVSFYFDDRWTNTNLWTSTKEKYINRNINKTMHQQWPLSFLN